MIPMNIQAREKDSQTDCFCNQDKTANTNWPWSVFVSSAFCIPKTVKDNMILTSFIILRFIVLLFNVYYNYRMYKNNDTYYFSNKYYSV